MRQRFTIYTALTIAALAYPTIAATEPIYEVLHRFEGGRDGFEPRGGLVQDASGNLYGVTARGGLPEARLDSFNGNGCGTVYRVKPPTRTGKPWKKEVLYRFKGTWDGCLPHGRLALGPDGTLYGTTRAGGGTGCGTVFKLQYEVNKKRWRLERLFEFRKFTNEDKTVISDGCDPLVGPLLDSDDTLYGTTVGGGPDWRGVVYRLAPSKDLEPPWDYTVLHAFANSGDGSAPSGELAFSAQGDIVGATKFGGFEDFWGTVYTLQRPNSIRDEWTYKQIHIFKPEQGKTLPVNPTAGVVLAPDTSLVGVASGLVYRLTEKAKGNWSMATIANPAHHPFPGAGQMYEGQGIAADSRGVIFGFSVHALYSVMQRANKPKKYKAAIIRRWLPTNSNFAGYEPYGAPHIGADGHIYGAHRVGAEDCGEPHTCGVVFRIKP